MPLSLTTVNTPPKAFFTFTPLVSSLLILSHGFISATKTETHKTQNPRTDPFQTACAVSKRWKIPTEEHPMIIGVPGDNFFEKFVKVNPSETLDEKKYDGFCIDIFREVLQIFLEKNYSLPYEFVPYNGTYDILVELVSNGTFEAAVGDITILTNRSNHAEFTQPYMESRLVMITPVKPHENAWKFLKPFTMEMWIATGAMLIYTTLIVWFLEHRSNPEFSGPWMNQLGSAVWFTFTSLFFSHREKINSNFTRVVVTVWLFVVLVLNSSYTAGLTSILTVSQLEPKVTSIEWLKKTNSNVGSGASTFLREYLERELKFKPENIKKIKDNEYADAFESGKIAAAFLELPYGKDFINQHSEGYTMTEPIYKRFGGLGFAFQKCSPIATNVSEAILTLLENGELKKLENKWFSSSFDGSDETANKAESVSLQSFWGIYLISGATSTILFLIHLLKNYRRHLEEYATYSSTRRHLQTSCLPTGEVEIIDMNTRL